MESYRTEEEQLEALKRWWDENGRSTVAAVVIALAGVFGWQSWQSNQAQRQEDASNLYQAMLRAAGAGPVAGEESGFPGLAEQLKSEYGSTTYAQFAALHLAALAVEERRLGDAQEQLRWVLAKADKGSDTARVAQVRLARVLAASGEIDQALAILDDAGEGAYGAAYAVAEGDILMGAGRNDEARRAYTEAFALAAGSGGRINLPSLQQKLQTLSPLPTRTEDALSDSATEKAPLEETVADDAIPGGAATDNPEE